MADRPNLADAIFEDLQQQILSGALAPGERLASERELAQQLGTNRNTLREAIRKLEHARLVTVRHGAGVRVTDFRKTATLDLVAPFLAHATDPHERVGVLLDLLVARAQVLEQAVRHAADRAHPEDIARLEALVQGVVDAAASGTLGEVRLAETAFFDGVVDAAHSLAVRWTANSLLDVYRGLMERFPRLYIPQPEFPAFLGQLMEALRHRDGDGASGLTRGYYRRTDRELTERLDKLFSRRPSPRPASKAAATSAPHPAPSPPLTVVADATGTQES